MKNKGALKKRIWLKLKYPKFALLILLFVLAYFIFQGSDTIGVSKNISSLGYFGAFIAGCLFTYGFTTPFAIVIFLILGETTQLNILVMTILGGFGALLGDFLIFKFIRTSFKDEVIKLEHEKIVEEAEHAIPLKIRHYIIPVLAGLIIASPLPDELGVTMLSVTRHIKPKVFAIISFVMNSLGILVMLLLGKAI
ncbi:hypothetical protein FJZ17_00900 [Candidatus Pacearchaeota archaeon]|nr:hypothetical protein [Candidatus Pacearchaeota archaeon]